MNDKFDFIGIICHEISFFPRHYIWFGSVAKNLFQWYNRIKRKLKNWENHKEEVSYSRLCNVFVCYNKCVIFEMATLMKNWIEVYKQTKTSQSQILYHYIHRYVSIIRRVYKYILLFINTTVINLDSAG